MAQNIHSPSKFERLLRGNAETKFLVVSGGSLSGLGKGTTISSIGVVLQSLGVRVTAMKVDPYLNIDAGTMSPFEHGEVFVLDDGGEVDLDLGNYERFLNITLSSSHSVTTGKIYDKVLKRERKGEYLGKTVQIVPHITDCIQDWITNVSYVSVDEHDGAPDVCLIELGGTVGDIESAVYLEALQQFKGRVGDNNFCLVHLGFVPVMGDEQKTKPTQHSVKMLREAGLKPDFLMCRCEEELEPAVAKKLAMFCQVPHEHVISLHNLTNLYHVPSVLQSQGAGEKICKVLNLDVQEGKMCTGDELPLNTNFGIGKMMAWKNFADRVDKLEEEVVIGIVGKYTGLQDSYMSVIKALKHAAIDAGLKLTIVWIVSDHLEPAMRATEPEKYDEAWKNLKNVMGVLVPGGFGDRGIEGKVLAAKYCRETKVPYFGICVGLQTAVMEFARTELGWDDANSTEFNESTTHPVVVFMPEVSTDQMGGTMRLGSRVTIVKEQECMAYKLYGNNPVIYERHRHRYEVNPQIVKALEQKGMKFTGQDERGQRMEIIEIPEHPFFLACQYHPEFKSRPMSPSPPFLGFVLAAGGKLSERIEKGDGKLTMVGPQLDANAGEL